MSQLIEGLESRTLLTAAPAMIQQDVTAVETAGTTAKADLAAAVKAAAADVKALRSAVAAAHPTSAQKKLLATAQKNEAASAAKLKKQLGKILAAGFRDGKKVVATLKALKPNPTDPALLAKASAAVTALSNVFSTTVVTTAESSAALAVTSVNASLDAVATAVPSAQTAVTTTEGHLSADLTTLSTDATALQTSIAQLAADLA